MSQQAIGNFNENSLIYHGSVVPAGDKEHPVSVKKVALRELPTTSVNIMSTPAENSPCPEEKGTTADFSKASVGTKRKQPDCPSSPSPNAHRGVNGHLVYVRRKLEKNNSSSADSLSSSILSRKHDNDETKELKLPLAKTQSPDSEITATTHALIDTEGLNTQDSKAPNDSQRQSNQDPSAPVDAWGDSSQDSDAPVGSQRLNNQERRKPIDNRTLSNHNYKAPFDPQRPSNEDIRTLDPQKLSNHDCKAPVDSQGPRKRGSNALADPHGPSNQCSKAPGDPLRLSNQDPKAPLDPQRPSNEDVRAPLDPQRLSNRDCEAPVDSQGLRKRDSNALADPHRPSNQCDKALGDPQRLSNQDPKALFDPQRLSTQNFKAPPNPQRANNQDNRAPADTPRLSNQNINIQADPQRPSNQDPKPSVYPQRTSNQEWKERYLQLQMFLKNCDQSSQEDYKSMLRSLTSADRSRHALELEKRALNLLLEEGKELHRMQVLNIIGEATSQEHVSPSTRTSASQPHFQRMETMHNPKSPFLRNWW
ncbi:sporozoite surface protein 2-like [Asparagus officinalis]|nr:sporozoite surface protein 2-like [Asparagus officinalis]